ncbi:histidine triad nucleotide-binding protein [Candidatus Dependentiae bacterium HGW-Dependentiae-1]|nr:MAG: histidine triad nucleotide-binding protein [Candidatus Dependentiae bacterium HGW-Dependentiae-1]
MAVKQECVFCKIVAKELPAKVIAENDTCLVIQDIAPKAPVHYLIIPKKHVTDISCLERGDANIPAAIFFMAQEWGAKLSGSGAFRLIVNNGTEVGQSVPHMHVHFVSGKKMTDF